MSTDLTEAAHHEQEQLRRQLAGLDAYFIVVPVAAEVHLVRDNAGVVREAAEVERRRTIMRREFGVDM